MKKILHPALALTLLICFLFVSSALSAQAAKHSTHHAQHKATTHSSNLCSWMCAAGQVLQSFNLEIREPSLSSLADDVTIPDSIKIVESQPTQSRAPPTDTSAAV